MPTVISIWTNILTLYSVGVAITLLRVHHAIGEDCGASQ